MLLLICRLLLALVLTVSGTRLMDYLYAADPAELSFPDRLQQRARFRRPLLLAGCLYICLTCPPAPAAVWRAVFSLFLLVIALMDWEQYIIYDRVLVALAVLALLRCAVLPVEPAHAPGLPASLPPLADYLLAGLGGGALLLLLAVLTHGAIGGGDIKLVAVLGLWLGSSRLVDALCLGFILGGLVAFLLLVTGRKKRRDFFAYGPYFAIAAWLCSGN